MPTRSRSISRDGDQAFQPESLCRSDGSSQAVAQAVTDGLATLTAWRHLRLGGDPGGTLELEFAR